MTDINDEMKVAAVKAYIAVDGKCRPAAMQKALEAALPFCSADMTNITKEMIEAHATADAEFAGVQFATLGKADKKRYLERSQRCLSAALSVPIDPKAEVEPVWRDGVPSKPWSDEWFIAETTYGDRVVLTALPEEWAYDFKTADDTYIKADRIKRWMQFPDSYYLPPASPSIVAVHPDDLAVDSFAAAMKAKLAKKRAEGRGGWENPSECSIAYLSELLRDHVNKGDPVDVGNLAMMIQQRGGVIE